MRIVDDDNKELGTFCGYERSGKVVWVNGKYALITFQSTVGAYPGFQLTISFTENQIGTFKYEEILS